MCLGNCLHNFHITELPPVSGLRYLNKTMMLLSTLDNTMRLCERKADQIITKGEVVNKKSYTGHVNSKYCMITSFCKLPEAGAGMRSFLVSGSEGMRSFRRRVIIL